MARRKLPLQPQDIKQIETMAGLGLKVEQMAAILGMSKATLDRRMTDTKGAFEALEKGRAAAILNVSKTAYQMALAGKVPAMTMFYLKCRAGWKETQTVEHSGPDGKPIETKSLTELPDDQLDAKIKAMMAKQTGGNNADQ